MYNLTGAHAVTYSCKCGRKSGHEDEKRRTYHGPETD
nr:MAG TPA: hypothetical protein [Caudoviricetes sp.]